MKTVPVAVFRIKNRGEREVFNLLSNINVSNYDIALHSLNLTGSEKKRWSEIDYLVVSQRGILALEVKGARASFDGETGTWSYGGPGGYEKNESPLTQAHGAAELLYRTWLAPCFEKELKKVAWGWAAVLTENIGGQWGKYGAPPEMRDELVAYKEDIANPESFKVFLNKAFNYYCKDFKARRGYDPSQVDIGTIKKIRNYLRPEIDRMPSIGEQVANLQEEQHKLTKEQYRVVDCMSKTDRMLVLGGAGTGKTFMLVYSARAEHSMNKSVLVVTRHVLLSKHISKLFKGRCIAVKDIETLRSEGVDEDNLYDVLLVDEGQDICTADDIDCLDKTIRGGMQSGRWRWFGDPNHQLASDVVFDDDAYEYLVEATGNQTVIEMNRNVRNTPQIVNWLEAVSNAVIGESIVRGAGPQVEVIFGSNASETLEKTRRIISGWLHGVGGQHLKASDIAILCVSPEDYDYSRKLLQGIEKNVAFIENEQDNLGDSLVIAGIESFKGLERSNIIVLGLEKPMSDDRLKSLTYCSVSRANAVVAISGTHGLLKRYAEFYGQRT